MKDRMTYKQAQNKIGVVYNSKARSSNLELLRIIAMLVIVAHHSVVNSGISDQFSFASISPNMIFLQLWGMWGKTAINAFVMITGYFMCTSKLTWKRFAKIYLEAKFYRVLFFIIFVIAGYEVISAKSVFKLLFGYIYGINVGFTSSFFAFYLFIPFMNALIEKLEKDLWKLILLLVGFFTIASTFFFNNTVFHHVFWYMTLYFVAAWIRLYPSKWMQNVKLTGAALCLFVLLSVVSVFVIDILGYLLHMDKNWALSYYMVSDSNKLLAFLVGVSAFLFFKNLKIKNSRIINGVASTTFGVLLIHANSDAMRQWLWKDLLNVPGMYDMSLVDLCVTEVAVMFGVFAVCSTIDCLRIQFIEKPVFRWINDNDEKIENGFVRIRNTVLCLCIRNLKKIV